MPCAVPGRDRGESQIPANQSSVPSPSWRPVHVRCWLSRRREAVCPQGGAETRAVRPRKIESRRGRSTLPRPAHKQHRRYTSSSAQSRRPFVRTRGRAPLPRHRVSTWIRVAWTYTFSMQVFTMARWEFLKGDIVTRRSQAFGVRPNRKNSRHWATGGRSKGSFSGRNLTCESNSGSFGDCCLAPCGASERAKDWGLCPSDLRPTITLASPLASCRALFISLDASPTRCIAGIIPSREDDWKWLSPEASRELAAIARGSAKWNDFDRILKNSWPPRPNKAREPRWKWRGAMQPLAIRAIFALLQWKRGIARPASRAKLTSMITQSRQHAAWKWTRGTQTWITSCLTNRAPMRSSVISMSTFPARVWTVTDINSVLCSSQRRSRLFQKSKESHDCNFVTTGQVAHSRHRPGIDGGTWRFRRRTEKISTRRGGSRIPGRFLGFSGDEI